MFSAITCDLPQAPQHATRHGNAITVGAQIYFVCESGYILQGNSHLMCQLDRSWNHNVPSCTGRFFYSGWGDPLHAQKLEVALTVQSVTGYM